MLVVRQVNVVLYFTWRKFSCFASKNPFIFIITRNNVKENTLGTIKGNFCYYCCQLNRLRSIIFQFSNRIIKNKGIGKLLDATFLCFFVHQLCYFLMKFILSIHGKKFSFELSWKSQKLWDILRFLIWLKIS